MPMSLCSSGAKCNFAYDIIMVSESKRFFFLNLFHLCDGILLAMCDVTVVATLVESTVNLCTVHLSCFKMAFASCPFPD